MYFQPFRLTSVIQMATGTVGPGTQGVHFGRDLHDGGKIPRGFTSPSSRRRSRTPLYRVEHRVAREIIHDATLGSSRSRKRWTRSSGLCMASSSAAETLVKQAMKMMDAVLAADRETARLVGS